MSEIQKREEKELVAIDDKAFALEQKAITQEIQRKTTRAALLTLDLILDELTMRAKDGTGAQELHGAKLGAVIGKLTSLAAALKQPAPAVVMFGGAKGNRPPTEDETFLRSRSAVNLSEGERQKMREQAKIVDAEIVKETK